MKSYLHVVAVTSLLLAFVPVIQADPGPPLVPASCEPTDVGCITSDNPVQDCLNGSPEPCSSLWVACSDGAGSDFEACAGSGLVWEFCTGEDGADAEECVAEVWEICSGPGSGAEECAALVLCGEGYSLDECVETYEESVQCIADVECFVDPFVGQVEDCVNDESQTCRSAHACVNGEIGSPCRPAHVCAQELAGSGTTSACGQARQEADDCQNGVAGSPCEPALTCVDEVTGSGETSPCGQARKASEDCQNGIPVFPCDPDPDFELFLPSACEYSCDATNFFRPVIGDPVQVPDVYLVECEIVIELPEDDQPIRHYFPALSPDADCPIPDTNTGAVQPLWTEDPDRVDVVLVATLNIGECDVGVRLLVYGEFGSNGPARVPCAFPIA